MNRMIRKLMVVLVAAFMFLGTVTTPVLAKSGKGGGNNGGGRWGWPWGWGWQQPEEPEPTEEPGEDEAPETTEEPVVEETEEPVYAEGELYDVSEHYKATVTFSQDAKIPEGTIAEVTEFAEGSPEYESAKAAVLAANDDTTGFAAFDISLSKDGNPVEPDGDTVNVSIELKNLPEEAIAAADTMVIQHINEVSGETETVATAENITVTGDDTATAEFAVNSFSTFVLKWGDEESPQSATIIWGYEENGEFVELEEGSVVTLDETASSVSLENSYEGYHYLDALYCTSGQSMADGADIQPILYKTDTGWACDVISSDEGEATTVTRTTVANGSTIYVKYFQQGTPTPSGADDAKIPSPETTKTVTDNGDGTYTIQLDVEGATVTEDNSHYANILIILDATRSMNGTKWTNAKAAMKTLIETLTEGENAANAGKIDFALVTFGRSATVVQNWTKNNTSFKSTCAGINMVTTSGTNWEAGMRGGLYGVLNSYPEGETEEDHDPTYVIFLTDGDPNVYYSSGSATNYTNTGTTNGYGQNSDTSATQSADEAKAIAAKTKLYGIYCGDAGTNPSGASFNRLVNVITGTGQGGQKTIAANADTIENEFKLIAQTMLDEMGASNVAVDDGVPSLSAISANVTGEAGGYKYYKKEADETEFTEWADAPGAIYSKDNGVTWDLSKVGTLPEKVTYRIEFTVWPSQAAYDLIADLNNGLVNYDDLTEEQKDSVTGSKETGYTLVTNTHLNTKYTFKDTEYSDKPKDLQYASMPLPTETVSVVKKWPENMVDEYGAAVYRDPDTGKTKEATEITLTLERDGTKYMDILVKGSEGWKKDDIYISCGNMTVANGVAKIHETGHDYQIVEPPQFLYYWDLISDVYHPMVINGKATLLVLDVDATAADVDNETYFEIGGKIYIKHSDTENQLEASNYRRSNLNLTKAVFDYNGEDPITDADAEFTFTAKVTDAYSTDGDVWFSAWDPAADGLVTDEWVTGAGVVAQGDGYFHAPNGTELEMTIKAGWNVRFLNIYHGSTFEFTETDMPNHYEFSALDAATQYDFIHESSEDWYKMNGNKITGTITEPNNNYTITYQNKRKAEFYVYHSGKAGDGNLETVALPVEGGTYDLTQNLTADTLYGGYYLDYAGKGDYQDDGVKGTTGVKYTGMNLDWSDPETETGTAITPVAGETYYIKEVPVYYLRNYHQINYMKASGKLTALYLISAVDDLNYKETGLTIQTNKETSRVSTQMTFKNTATNKSVTLKANTVFKSLGITGDGSEKDYLTYFDATSGYMKTGTYTVLPYWVTPDGITVTGISTRTITISSLTKSGITKTDN